MLLLSSSNVAYAHSPEFTVRTPEDILKFCEFFYDEYLLLGMDKLSEQHEQFPNLRACEILYNHIAWKSTHPLRNKVLIAEIEKFLGDSAIVKERHLLGYNTLPNWIKGDAKKWVYSEITDAKFAYDIRSMIENNLITIKSTNTNSDTCVDDICLSKDIFAEYSITNNFGESKNIKFTVTDITGKSIMVVQREVSKNGINSNIININPELKFQEISNDSECCTTFRFIHPNSLSLNSIVGDDHKIVGETKYAFKQLFRDAWIIKNTDGSYVEIVDKKTGIVFSISFQENDIITKWKKIVLTDTNNFEKKSTINPTDMKIPTWWKTTTMWYLDGLITEEEYLGSLKYLFENRMLIV